MKLLHLVFVDDILVFTNWRCNDLKSDIFLFYFVDLLCIQEEKYCRENHHQHQEKMLMSKMCITNPT